MNVFKQLLLSLVLIGACVSCADDKKEDQGTNSLPTPGIGLRQLHLDLNEKTGTDSIAGILSERTTVILRMRGANDPIDLSLLTVIERNGDNGSVRLRVEDDQLTSIPLQPYYVNYILYSKKDIVSKTTVPMDTISLGLCLDLSDADNIQITNRYSPSLRTSGSGVDGDPIVILDRSGFMSHIIDPLMRGKTLNGRYFRISCEEINIDSNSGGNSNWNPAGLSIVEGVETRTPFKGNIDGGNCIIKTLVSTNQDYSGLFYSLEDATIKNLKLYVNLRSNTNLGGIAYNAINSSIDNVTVYGTMHADGYAGGLFAEAHRVTITNSIVDVAVLNNDVNDGNNGNNGNDSSDNNCIGGFVGYAVSINIEHSVMKGSISCTNTDCVGGFIGELGESGSVTFESLASIGHVEGSSNVGGFIGCIGKDVHMDARRIYLGYDRISEEGDALLVQSSVLAESENVGGLAGCAHSCLINIINYKSAHTSTEIMANDDCAGGLFGRVDSKTTVHLTNIMIHGAIVKGGMSGGLFGLFDKSNLEIYEYVESAIGTVSGLYVGGLAGYWGGDNRLTINSGKVKINSVVKSDISQDENWVKSCAGGLMGYSNSIVIEDCSKFDLRNIDVSGYKAGGLIGDGGRDCTIKNFDGTKISTARVEGVYSGGLIGYAGDISISNCNVKATLVALSLKDRSFVMGGVSGYVNEMKISNVRIESIDATGIISKQGQFGGISGTLDAVNNPMISDCSIDKITLASFDDAIGVGGVIGRIEGLDDYDTSCTIKSTVVKGVGKLTGSNYVGGIVGQHVGATDLIIENCLNLMPIEVHSKVWERYGFGGILGHNGGTVHIKHSGNKAKINGSCEVGGIVGGVQNESYQQTEIDQCYNEGFIDGLSEMGGLIGMARQDITIYNSYNKGTINNGSHVGGLVGYFKDLTEKCELHQCYNIASSGYGTIGGIDGNKNEKFINAINLYYANNGGDYTYEKGKMYSAPIDANKLNDTKTFYGFDFGSNGPWRMIYGYPTLAKARYE